MDHPPDPVPEAVDGPRGDLAARIPLDELRSLAASIIQADELGAALGPTLRIQAEALREGRSQRAEKLAHEAPVKIMLPLFAFLFPSVIIVVFGPLLIDVFKLP